MSQPVWYFDFISPFAYFQFVRFETQLKSRDFILKPVLFAGLLKHWQHKGPAELGAKRAFTYRFAQWYASHHNIAYRMPAAHPFNPLAPLRLSIALGNNFATVRAIFEFFWRDGLLLDSEQNATQLAHTLGIANIEEVTADERVKQMLVVNTQEAVDKGVFGVPTAVVGEHLFWGVDASEMLFDYLDDPTGFETDEMKRVTTLPYGVKRQT